MELNEWARKANIKVAFRAIKALRKISHWIMANIDIGISMIRITPSNLCRSKNCIMEPPLRTAKCQIILEDI
jgi:hypothetical protein